MGSFQSGFQMGGDIANQAIRNAMAERELAMKEAADARQAEAHGLAMTSARRVEDATQSLDNITRLGVQIPGAAEGNRQANMESLRRFEIGQQNGDEGAQYTAPTGLQPTYRPASDRDLNTAQMGLAAAKGDMSAMAALTQARRNLDMGDIASKVMKAPIKDLEGQAANLNLSGYPLLYTGKDKNGYTFLKTENDGKTPIAGSQFSLNEAQLRQMALAHELGAGGFGTEAMAALQAAHKDVGEHVGKWNAAMTQTATTNNTAVHNANADQSARISANAAATTANAAVTNANTNKSLRDAQIKEINDRTENKAKALELMTKWDKLSADDQMGPAGDAILREYNMINVKAGGTVSLGPKGGKNGLLSRGVEQKKNDDGTYTAFDKQTGEAVYNTINGEPIPLGMDATAYSAHKKAAQEAGVKLVVGENNGRLQLRYQGADGQFYEDAASAKYAKADGTPAQARGLTKPTRTAGPNDVGVVTASVDPQTKQRTYSVSGIRQRFATRQEAESAAAKLSGSDMSRVLNRFGD